MNFGEAIRLLKEGHRVAREGWNGKGMWLALSRGSPALEADKFWARPNRVYAEENGGTAPVLPCITMKTATGEILMGWLASQTDMLAEDWVDLEVIEAPPPTPAAPPSVEEVIGKSVEKLLQLAARGQLGRMPERPVDVLVSVCTRHLQDNGTAVPADLRQRCNDALMSALLKG